jgi:hypothetical protein
LSQPRALAAKRRSTGSMRGRAIPAARSTCAGSAPPTTARTDGSAARRPSSRAAAHPITTVSSAGPRRAVPRRATCRTKRRSLASLSAVTVHEFTTATSAAAGSSTTTAPWSANACRTSSVSYWFALQPKVWK